MQRSHINECPNLTFMHDRDLRDHDLIAEQLPNATIKFDVNDLCKKNKKVKNKSLETMKI